MSSKNYDTTSYIDIHRLRKKAAKATGCHHQFSKKKMKAQPTAAEEVVQEHEEEKTMKKVCQETRLDDLSERIPPLAALLRDMTANNDASTREIADELATELQVWKMRLEEAISEFEIDTAECSLSEKQLERLGELHELVRSTIKAHNKRPKVATPSVESGETELIRFSSFARPEPASAVEHAPETQSLHAAAAPTRAPRNMQAQIVTDPFQSRFDPFGEQDAKAKVMSLYHQEALQQAVVPRPRPAQMALVAPATGLTDPFAPHHAQDPFAQQMKSQPLAHHMHHMQQMQQMQQMPLQMHPQQASAAQKAPMALKISLFDPYAPVQQSA
jgi:hypothetical protein